ncbi:MAG: CHAT domain-containing tetratricopeptide repeat protein [Candidatus Aminicenantales bacterium]
MRRIRVLFSFLFIASILSFPANRKPSGLQREELSAIALIKKGEAYKRSGDFEKAFAAFTEALTSSKKMKNPGGEVICLLKLGITSWDLANISDSGVFFEEALSLAQKHKDVLNEHFCRSALGVVHFYLLGKEFRSKNQNQKSLESFDRALALGDETGIEDFALKCLRQKSMAYWQMGDFQAFYACAKRGLEISKKINHRTEMGRCLNNLGAFYERLSDYSNALKYLEEAQVESTKVGDQATEAESLSNIGGIYLELDNLIQAEVHYRKALSIDRKLGNELNIVMDLNNLGIVLTKRARTYNELGALSAALQYFRDGQGILENRKDKRILIQIINNIGYAYYLDGKFEEAGRNYKIGLAEAVASNYKEATCAINLNLGNLDMARNSNNAAITCFNSAVESGIASESQEILWEAYSGLGQCYEAKKELMTALSYYKRSIEIIEKIRSHINLDIFKISFTRDKLIVYQRALDVLSSIYSTNPSETVLEELFQIMERAKARSFVESLIEARVNCEEGLNPKFIEREKEISKDISAISWQLSESRLAGPAKEKRLQELEFKEEKYLRLISEMRVENRDVANIVFPPIASLSQVQTSLLNETTALLEYFVGDKNSFLFVISRRQIRFYKLPGRSILEDSLRAYLKILASPSPRPFGGIQASERIAGELVFPLKENSRSEIDTLVIIPDGVLHYLPFETLRMTAEGKAIYLVEKYNISYGPSSTSLLLLRENPRRLKSEETLLAFGDPLERGGIPAEGAPQKASADLSGARFVFPRLPYSRQEVLNVARLFHAQNRAVFMQDAATETIIKKMPLEKYDVIHFACHGQLDEKYPFRSALVLSSDQNQEEDGLLQVREIYGLRMNAGLVVLSACHSGNGTVERGEGLFGLARTFFYAGARAVLSSIWSVNDRSTAVFMEDFYKGLVRGQDKIAALRMTKLKMLRSGHSHPYYWAGFVLNGDSAPLWFDEKATHRAN